MKKKGVSEVVSTILILGLVIAVIGIVWAVINSFIQKELDETGSCLETFDKVKIDARYTCYNSTTQELRFAIEIGDVNVSKVLVGISSPAATSTFTINSTGGNIPYVFSYPSHGTNISLPGKNGGKTYLFNTVASGVGIPDQIDVAPISGGNQCDVSDSLEQIDNCFSVLS